MAKTLEQIRREYRGKSIKDVSTNELEEIELVIINEVLENFLGQIIYISYPKEAYKIEFIDGVQNARYMLGQGFHYDYENGHDFIAGPVRFSSDMELDDGQEIHFLVNRGEKQFEDDNVEIRYFINELYDLWESAIREGIEEAIQNATNKNESLDDLDESLDESLALPVTPLSESAIDSACKAIYEGKKGKQITLGYFKSIPVAAKFTPDRKTGENRIDKETGELYPIVHALKCVEMRGRTGISYGEVQRVKDYHSTDAWLERHPEDEIRDSKIPEWIYPNVLGVNTRGNKVLVFWPHPNSRPNASYYIAIDDEDYRPCTKNDLVPYLTPASANALLNPIDRNATDENGNPISTGVGYMTKGISEIYKLDTEGSTFMMKGRYQAKKAVNDFNDADTIDGGEEGGNGSEQDESLSVTEAVSKKNRETEFYPDELKKILENSGWIRMGKRGDIYGLLESGGELAENEIGAIFYLRYVQPDYKNVDTRRLNADRVGDELLLGVGVIDFDATPINSNWKENKFVRKIEVPLSRIIDDTYEITPNKSSALPRIIELYKEAHEIVEKESSNRYAERAKETMTPEEVESARTDLAAKGNYPGVNDEFLRWCREHLLEIIVGCPNDQWRELLKNRFNETSYEFRDTGIDRRSWEARVRFDEIDDCPNKQIEKDARYLDDGRVTVDRVELAKTLYDNGFDFGSYRSYNPKYVRRRRNEGLKESFKKPVKKESEFDDDFSWGCIKKSTTNSAGQIDEVKF